jgi:hypothetical protein
MLMVLLNFCLLGPVIVGLFNERFDQRTHSFEEYVSYRSPRYCGRSQRWVEVVDVQDDPVDSLVRGLADERSGVTGIDSAKLGQVHR